MKYAEVLLECLYKLTDRDGGANFVRLKDQATSNVIVRQYKRRLDDEWMWYYDLLDYDQTMVVMSDIGMT